MSDRRLRAAIAVLAVLEVGVAGYLTYVHYAHKTPLCLASGGCETVQRSPYAELVGVPVALLGVLGCLAILGSLVLPGETGRAVGALVALVSFGFSGYLTYRELFTIDAICTWCVASATLMTVVAAASVWRLLRAPVTPAVRAPAPP
jgi:uncharacterized membrane protein